MLTGKDASSLSEKNIEALSGQLRSLPEGEGDARLPASVYSCSTHLNTSLTRENVESFKSALPNLPLLRAASLSSNYAE